MTLTECGDESCKLFHDDESWDDWVKRTGYGVDVYAKKKSNDSN
jgi:hypothetical protein